MQIQNYAIYDLGDNVTWGEVNKENLEEAVELIADTFGQNPGNPGFLSIGIPKSEIKQIWTKKLEYLVERTLDPANSLVQMLFRYKGKPAGFFYTLDVQDELQAQKNAIFLNSKWEFKATIDKHFATTVVQRYPQRYQFLHSWIGVNSVTGFEGLASVMDQEIRLQLAIRGWRMTGSNTYNPRMVRLTARNKGTTVGDLNIEDFEFEGRKVYKEYKEPMVLTYVLIPVDEETNRKYFPHLIPRYEQIKKEFALRNSKAVQPKL